MFLLRQKIHDSCTDCPHDVYPKTRNTSQHIFFWSQKFLIGICLRPNLKHHPSSLCHNRSQKIYRVDSSSHRLCSYWPRYYWFFFPFILFPPYILIVMFNPTRQNQTNERKKGKKAGISQQFIMQGTSSNDFILLYSHFIYITKLSETLKSIFHA